MDTVSDEDAGDITSALSTLSAAAAAKTRIAVEANAGSIGVKRGGRSQNPYWFDGNVQNLR